MNSADKKILDSKLKDWGRYRRKDNDCGLGYGSRNSIDRMMSEGVGAGQSTSSEIYIDTSDENLLMDKIIVFLEDKIKTAIEEKYINNFQDAKAANKCHCSKSEFRSRIEKGLCFISGVFYARNAL